MCFAFLDPRDTSAEESADGDSQMEATDHTAVSLLV